MSNVFKTLPEAKIATSEAFFSLMNSHFFEGSKPGYSHVLHELALVSLRALYAKDIRSISKLFDQLLFYNKKQERDVNTLFLYSRLARPTWPELISLQNSLLDHIAKKSQPYLHTPTELAVYVTHEKGGRDQQHDGFFIKGFENGIIVSVMDGISKYETSRQTVELLKYHLSKICDLSTENVVAAIQKSQQEIAKIKRRKSGSEQMGGSTIVLFIYFDSGKIVSISIGDSSYAIITEESNHKNQLHVDENGAITQAIGSYTTAATNMSEFITTYTTRPQLTLLHTDGLSQISRFTNVIESIISDQDFPVVLRLFIIDFLNWFITGQYSDNRTAALVVPTLPDLKTEPLLRITN
jgi:serine/threonine protein phosphatase PrpC